MDNQDISAEQLAQNLFDKWNTTLQTNDPAIMADLYTNNASFLPTMSPDFKHGHDGVESYFSHFMKSDPIGEVTDSVAILSDDSNMLIHSGMYTFVVDKENTRVPVSARFTFVWVKKNNDWKIYHHHSSLLPQV